MQNWKLTKSSIFLYALLGFLLGCLFPVFGTAVSILGSKLPIGWSAIYEAQKVQPILWVIDSAPLLLGISFGIAGHREDKLKKLKTDLDLIVNNQLTELQNLANDMESEINIRKGYENKLQSTTKDLRLISQVTRVLSEEQENEILLPLITNTVSEQFGFYHVGIFLMEDNGKYAALKASNSAEGKRMVEQGHRLEVGQVGIVGSVASTGKFRISSDVTEDAVYFNNPNLPETRSEIAFPLIAHQNIIGVIDIQSHDSDAFSEERIETLSILADQIAFFIESSRTFTDMQNALTEARAFSSQLSTQSWKNETREQIIGFLHNANGGKKLSEFLDWEEARQAISRSQTVVKSNNDDDSNETALAVPLRIREQTIGVLDIRASNPNRIWQEEEIHIVQAIADRVGLALENARLFEETTSRANRERTVTEITTHIRSTNDPDEMLQTALNDLKRVLGAKDIQIKPYSPRVNDSPMDGNIHPAQGADKNLA